MPAFSPDANCMIAIVCSWHVHHEAATGEVGRRLRRGEDLVVAAPALVEAYSVLTRLPAPHRLSPADAWALLETNFVTDTRVIALDASAYRELLVHAAADGVAGGRVYDAVIATCVLKSARTTLLTFNIAHFVPFRDAGLAVVSPAGETRA